jgi:Mrp family chromosome partitioning ATPase
VVADPSNNALAELVVVQSPDSDAAQAYRSVRETLRHAKSDTPIRSILLADAGSDDQTGEAAANIATSFALNGNPTVLVDLGAANPVLDRWLGSTGTAGLLDWLRSDGDEPHAVPVTRTGIEHLSLLTTGGSQSQGSSLRGSIADLMTDQACQQLIGQLRISHSYVIFHGSVVPVTSQVLTVAAHVDAVALIVRSGTTKRTDAQRAREALQRVGANILGVVLTESS